MDIKKCSHSSWEIKAHNDRVCCDCDKVIGKGEPKFTLTIPGRHTEGFDSLASARDAYKRLRDESMEGGSTWPDGIITGKSKIYLSYNGRAWADRQHTQSIDL